MKNKRYVYTPICARNNFRLITNYLSLTLTSSAACLRTNSSMSSAPKLLARFTEELSAGDAALAVSAMVVGCSELIFDFSADMAH